MIFLVILLSSVGMEGGRDISILTQANGSTRQDLVWGFGRKIQKFPSKIHYFHQKSYNLARISPRARVRN